MISRHNLMGAMYRRFTLWRSSSYLVVSFPLVLENFNDFLGGFIPSGECFFLYESSWLPRPLLLSLVHSVSFPFLIIHSITYFSWMHLFVVWPWLTETLIFGLICLGRFLIEYRFLTLTSLNSVFMHSFQFFSLDIFKRVCVSNLDREPSFPSLW